jgi:hypothetical protein
VRWPIARVGRKNLNSSGLGVMSAQFWPCPGCSRHVKRGDATCPFCGASASVEIGPTRVLAGRLSRSALFAAGAVGVGIATTDCIPTSMAEYGGISAPIEIEDSSASDGPREVGADTGDAGTREPSDSSSAADAPMAVAAYGAAVIIDE